MTFMHRNSWARGNLNSTWDDRLPLHNDGYNMEPFSSPSPDALQIHRGSLPDHWNLNDGEYMRLICFISEYMLPQCARPPLQHLREGVTPTPRHLLRDYITVTGMFIARSDIFPHKHTSITNQMGSMVLLSSGATFPPSDVVRLIERSSYNPRLNYSETPRSHHSADVQQHSSWKPQPTKEYENAADVSSRENVTRNRFGWKLRPVSELRA